MYLFQVSSSFRYRLGMYVNRFIDSGLKSVGDSMSEGCAMSTSLCLYWNSGIAFAGLDFVVLYVCEVDLTD